MNRGYFDPIRTRTPRCVQWIPPKRQGHRCFMSLGKEKPRHIERN